MSNLGYAAMVSKKGNVTLMEQPKIRIQYGCQAYEADSCKLSDLDDEVEKPSSNL